MSLVETSANLSQLVDRFITHIRDAKNLATNTVKSYQYDLRDFVRYMQVQGLDDFAEVDEVFVEDYLAHTRQQGYAAQTTNRRLHAIRGLARFLVRRRLILRNFAADVSGLKMPRPLPVVLDRDQITALLDAPNAGQDPMYLRDRCILELLYGSGLRAFEAIGLRVSDIHANSESIRILGKGAKGRTVPVTRTAVLFAEEYKRFLRPALARDDHPVAHLFLTRAGRALCTKNTWRLVQRYAQRIGLNDQIGPHTLRHCFATHMLEAGASLVAVQRLLGHATISTTERYLHISVAEVEATFRECCLRDGPTGCGS